MWKRLGIALFWLAVWQLLALLIHNPVVLVGPWETLGALVRMLPTAVPARMRPMEITMGPVTTGGKSFITLLTPKAFTQAARTK